MKYNLIYILYTKWQS